MSDTTLVEILKKGYNDGHTLEVTFTKSNGDIRKMIIQRNQEFMESTIKGSISRHTDSVMRVCELLTTENPNGEFQWRSIPLNRLISVKEIAPF